MYISATKRMKKIHIWIGTTFKTEDEYYNYFEQEFAQDIGVDEYDGD